MSQQTDQEIIQKILTGHVDAYKLLVDRYSEPLLNLCYRYLSRREEAEDATQEVLIKAYASLASWEPRAQFKTWLYRIAINHCLNVVRRQKIVTFQSLNSEDFETFFSPGSRGTQPEGGEQRLVIEQREKLIQYYLGKLPESHRHVLILYFYQQLSYKEIANILNVSLSSVESRLFRAKKKLAKLLSRQKKSLSKFF